MIKLVLRDPFLLNINVHIPSYYEQKMAKIPYVYKTDIYLFSGESFGINGKN